MVLEGRWVWKKAHSSSKERHNALCGGICQKSQRSREVYVGKKHWLMSLCGRSTEAVGFVVCLFTSHIFIFLTYCLYICFQSQSQDE